MSDVWIISPEDLPIPPTKGGSVQIYTSALIHCLAQSMDISFTLLSPNGHVGKLPSTHPSTYTHHHISNRHGKYLEQIVNMVAHSQPDIVQIENRPQFVWPIHSCSPKTKIILNLHSTTFIHTRHLPQPLVQRCLQHLDAIVCNSQYLRQTLIKQLGLHTKKQIPVVIYPGVHFDEFASPTERVLHNPIQLLYVGRIIRQKGLHVLLRALPLLKHIDSPIHLTILGRTPPWEAQYAKLVHSLSNQQFTTWGGFISPRQLAKFYQAADIFVCPSQQDEAFGLVNIEAMASGLPVIASHVGGISETVTPMCGSLVEQYQSPLAFAAAIENLICHPQEWAQKSAFAKRRAALFSWSSTARQFNNLYQTILHLS